MKKLQYLRKPKVYELCIYELVELREVTAYLSLSEVLFNTNAACLF